MYPSNSTLHNAHQSSSLHGDPAHIRRHREMDRSAGMEERRGAAHHHAHGTEVTPDRDSLGNPAPKRARRRLETDTGSDDADDTHAYGWGTSHNGGGRQREDTASTAQLLSESIIELLHVCTLIQVELNNNSTNASDQPDECDGMKQEGSDSSAHAHGSSSSC